MNTSHIWLDKLDVCVRGTSDELNVIMLNNENGSSSDGNSVVVKAKQDSKGLSTK